MDRTRRSPVWGLAASALLMAWMRPTDAVWVTLPLLLTLVVLRRWRHWRLLIALAGGLAAGAAEWVIEAYARFGGLSQRLSEGSDIQGGLGWHVAIGDQLRSLGGRSLCRPCTGAMPNPAVTAWWFALPMLAVVGLAVAVRSRRTPPTALPLACAVTAAIPYLFLIGYAAPRFLLPTYALLAIPVADALVRLVTAPGGAWRPVTVTLVAMGLAGHLAVQYAVLEHTVQRTTAAHAGWERTAAALRRVGVRPPCLLTGPSTLPIAFYAGCGSASTSGPNANADAATIAQTAQRMLTAVLTTGATRPPSYARGWRLVRLEGAVYAYIAPTARQDRGA